jgi:hypothetical protein
MNDVERVISTLSGAAFARQKPGTEDRKMKLSYHDALYSTDFQGTRLILGMDRPLND